MPDLRFRTESLSADERQRLILHHLPRVRLLARKIHGRLPDRISLDDLISTGIVGLISAIDRFDPSHQVQLGTYAEHKIKGAILDSLRRLDWAPRQHRKHAKQIEAAIAVAEQRWQRLPTNEEVAAELNVGIDVYHERQAMLHSLNLESLEAIESGDAKSCHRCIPHDRQHPSAVFERRELCRALAEGISRLPEIQQTVLSMYYRDELRPREISKIIGLQESRVGRIKRQAILQLRIWMLEFWPSGARRDCPN